MPFSSRPHQLIDAAAPYWAGEAAVFEAYWTWEQRTRESDLAWLNHQYRILMRNAQFGRPLEGARLDDALAGRCQPVRFDYERARRAA